ncbi:MAG TPA: hypothetical protein VFP66_16315 [Candidatus Limnocylindrales bacterium]|jgi:hypothetical protein|nr:hypothetical protein [Candidatus Limnocylindrales bacterium]
MQDRVELSLGEFHVVPSFPADPPTVVGIVVARGGVLESRTAWSKWAVVTLDGPRDATRRHLQGGTLALLDHAKLVRELISLEQHPLPSGRPRIAALSGGADDYATALLALVAALAWQGLTRPSPVRGSGV